MKGAPQPGHIGLPALIGDLRRGRFVIPDFQREFEWEPWDIRQLVRSIFLDYYIGSLLLWKGRPDNFAALACEPIYGCDAGGDGRDIVLDGQQRLTAMHYVFVAPNKPLPKRKNRYLYFIRIDRFMEEAYDEAFEYDWTRGGEKLLEDRSAQFDNHRFPVSVVGQHGGFGIAFWVRDYEEHWNTKAESARKAGDDVAAREAERRATDAREFGEHLRAITQEYQITYIQLDQDLEIDKVCDIFTQINSRGTRLDIFDLINALLKPKGLQLKHLWRSAAPRFEFVDTKRMNVYLLQVMSILRQAYCSPKYLYYLLPGQERTLRGSDGSLRKEILVPDVADFKRRWEDAVAAVESAIRLLRHPQGFGAISSQYLPYVSILPAFAALQATLRRLPAPRQLAAQRKVRHWYWASVFTNRYSGSVESTSARDYLDVKAWFADDDAEPGLVAEFRARFKTLDLRRETKRGTSVYNGIFNLLVLNGAPDWITGNPPQYGDLDDHHIVPKSWGKEEGLGRSIDTVLNRTSLTADTNRKVIRGRIPSEYLPELIGQSGETSVRAILESHFVSPPAFDILLRDPFTKDDFEAFLTVREHTLRAAIEDLLVKERLDLPPRLRELDARIEAIELDLRRVVDAALDGDPAQLPPHVRQKIEERLQQAFRRNATLDGAHYESLGGKLEYADLRELQDTITNKMLWRLFEVRFASKGTLLKHFGELAELRNGIRHSRSVDEISRKAGEAAILWFEKVTGS
ncbi:GmrSD restriction endonuclease domain-containing protein [Candidatus Palauibacter sp.]|uniref:GmrSD restriction endonuclease domain-containing protein n=1 Tax=Candidatus Palauibacter sp. TaxID=3101350 RepID=UPI003B51E529